MSLRFLSQQPPVIYVKCDRLQPRIEPVTYSRICPLRAVSLGHVADKSRPTVGSQLFYGGPGAFPGTLQFYALHS